MKTNLLLILGALILILHGCSYEEERLIETNRDPEVKSSSIIPLPVISKNQVVIRYGPGFVPSTPPGIKKRTIRAAYHVLDYETCSCGDDSLELWTIDTSEIDVEEIVDNLSPPPGDVEGDYQFTFDMDNDDKVASGLASNLNGKLVISDTGDPVDIAVIDTGVDYDYFDEPFLYYEPDDAGCLTEVSGWDFVNEDPDIRDDHGHGTLVTKLITSELDAHNIDYNILSVKAFDKKGKGSYWNMVCALNYVTKKTRPVDLINMSFGWYGVPDQDIMKNLIEEAGTNTLMVASAGNHGVNTDTEYRHFPSGYTSSNLLTVGGYKVTGPIRISSSGDILEGIALADESNYGGHSIDMVATFGPYRFLMKSPGKPPFIADVNGTSFAAAYITAKAAGIYGNNTPEVVKNDVLMSAYTAEAISRVTKEGKVILRGEPVNE